jgi:antitoxin (DNA-binding transcriptional repressor) of toxin-antitoxin stability system
VKTIKLSQASRSLAEYAAELGDEIVVLTDRDTPVAAIVPLRAADRESLVLSNHPEFLAIVAHARAEVRTGRTLSLVAMKQKFQARQSPNRRLQPTKARGATVVKRGSRKRLRG